MAKIPLSVAVIAHNEEKNLPRALESCQGWGAEIVVVDAGSSDKTGAIARQFTDKVYRRPNNPQLNVNKTEAFKECTREWIFYLDADEELTPALKRAVEKAIIAAPVDGYWVPRKNIIFGHWMRYGGNYPDAGVRLFRRAKGHFECKHVHEHLQVDGPVGRLAEPFNHYAYETISQWLTKLDFYTNLEAKLIEDEKQNPWVYIFIRPPYKFVRNYFFKLGLLDGKVGFLYAVLNGYYDFMAGAKVLTAKPSSRAGG